MNSKAILYALWTFTVAGTAAALPPIHSEISFDGAGRIKVTWATQPGESYFLQSTRNLAGPWQDLQTDPPLLVATTNTLAYELEVTGQMRFFRVGWAYSVPRMVQISSGTFEMGDAFGEVWSSGWLEYPVQSGGDLAANGYGLYDMAGNLAEWCWDRYGEYGGTPLVDPRGSGPGEDRVSRGGSWFDTAIRCRVSWRHNAPPKGQSLVRGFRCVLSSGPP